MDYLGQLPVRTNLHLIITPEEQRALVNALMFFWSYYGADEDINLRDWQLTANDEPLPLYDQLATKIARLT